MKKKKEVLREHHPITDVEPQENTNGGYIGDYLDPNRIEPLNKGR